MKKYTERKEEETTGWKPTMRDADDLRQALKQFKEPKIINGKKQYAFQQYLAHKNIVSFGEKGDMLVRNPLQYHRVSQTHGLMEWKDQKDFESIIETYPEEKAAFLEKRKEVFKMMREVFHSQALSQEQKGATL